MSMRDESEVIKLLEDGGSDENDVTSNEEDTIEMDQQASDTESSCIEISASETELFSDSDGLDYLEENCQRAQSKKCRISSELPGSQYLYFSFIIPRKNENKKNDFLKYFIIKK